MEQYNWAQDALGKVTQQTQEERRRLWTADGTTETRTQRRKRERQEKKLNLRETKESK
jgi:hypothetical protein